eukprot:GHVU01151496.1.p2 GENE.GHVU01151496.1~~GHVU01151496.1.p2  ORF type:complete len:209 (-),score=36.71 GHVU01151496.1:621-1247(-)
MSTNMMNRVLRVAEERNFHVEWAEGYAEPGYDTPEAGVVFGDWNDRTSWNPETRETTTLDATPSRLARIFERMGLEVEWCDEWATCGECYRAVRTSPDCHSWLPSYLMGDGDLTCAECVESDPAPHLEAIEGDPNRGWTLDIDPALHGYERHEDGFETGFHSGQDADPHAVAAKLEAEGVTRYLFRIDGTGQFDMTWSVYVPVASDED